MAEELVRTEIRGAVAVAHLDDGKANAISPAMIAALHGVLDRAEAEAGAALLVGREGRFSGGFDLAVLRSGPEPMLGLLRGGAELFLRFLEYPKPLVIACTGHAIAAGAIALLGADARIGARGSYRVGLTEVAIGMTLPIFALEMARHRLSKRHFTRAVTQGEAYDPEGARDAGYLDRLVEPAELEAAAYAEAEKLAALPQPAFANTKRRTHAALVAGIRESLDADLRGLTGQGD